MISLQDRILSHPISDPAYLRHLRTADVFNSVQAARERMTAAEKEYEEAQRFLEAEVAKAKLIESMENL